MSAQSSVLYDVPGPRARVRNKILTAAFSVLALLAVFWIYLQFADAGQLDADLWTPFLEATTWTQYILPGLLMTLQAAAVAMVLSLAFGMIFAVGRLSERKWLSVISGMVVEVFRAIPLLIMMFFIFFGVPMLIGEPVPAFWCVVVGLTLYNGSVLAEAFRSGIKAVPKGQSEAAYALGLRKSAVMRLILIPQAGRLMLPVIVGQLVVLLKDTALGYIVALPELMQKGVNDLSANYGNVVAAAIVVACIYILMNSLPALLAHYGERRAARNVPDDEKAKAEATLAATELTAD
mgnify:FL=1